MCPKKIRYLVKEMLMCSAAALVRVIMVYLAVYQFISKLRNMTAQLYVLKVGAFPVLRKALNGYSHNTTKINLVNL